MFPTGSKPRDEERGVGESLGKISGVTIWRNMSEILDLVSRIRPSLFVSSP